jgi:hypothetical protein
VKKKNTENETIYSVGDDGKVFAIGADGVTAHIATLNGTILVYLDQDGQDHHEAVSKAVTKAGFKWEKVSVSAPARTPAEIHAEASKIVADETESTPDDPVFMAWLKDNRPDEYLRRVGTPARQQNAAHEQEAFDALNPVVRKAVRKLRFAAGLTDQVEVAPNPRPRFGQEGDKTPAFVDHLLRYEPAEFARRYGVMREDVVQQVEITEDPNTFERKKRVREVDAVIARRKTHLTEKPKLNENLGGEGEQ